MNSDGGRGHCGASGIGCRGVMAGPPEEGAHGQGHDSSRVASDEHQLLTSRIEKLTGDQWDGVQQSTGGCGIPEQGGHENSNVMV